MVDVVIEVRDARILSSTTHPMVSTWVQNRPILVAISRIDQATKRSLIDWKVYYKLHPPYSPASSAISSTASRVFFLDGNRGDGIDRIRKQLIKIGAKINEKRQRLGIMPRPVRAAVIGFPNVGKSSVINRLLNRKLAPVQNVAGYTKAIRWVRVSDKNNLSKNHGIELLDSPGIIPARMNDQSRALFLAICNDIGESSYDKHRAAIALIDRVIEINKYRKGYVSLSSISARYKIPFNGEMTGEEIITLLAERNYQSQELVASEKILADFRKGYWGLTTLEYPPNIEEIDQELRKKRSDREIEKGQEEVEEDTGDEQTEEEDSEVDSPTTANTSIERITETHRRDDDHPSKQPLPTIKGASDKGNYDGW